MSQPRYSENENVYDTPWDILKNMKIRGEKKKQSILRVRENKNKGKV